MPFANPKIHRAYRQGYHLGHRLCEKDDVSEADVTVPFSEAETDLREAFFRGFRAGAANRAGEKIAERQANWYQQNKPKIVARQRTQRRVAIAVERTAALGQISKHISEVVNSESS